MHACKHARWDEAEHLALEHLRINGRDSKQNPVSILARAGLAVALRRSGQCYDHQRQCEPLPSLCAALATHDPALAQQCAYQLLQLLRCIFSDDHYICRHLSAGSGPISRDH